MDTSLETKQFLSIRKLYLRYKLSWKKNVIKTTLLMVILSTMISLLWKNSSILTSIPTLKVKMFMKSFVSSWTSMLVTKTIRLRYHKTKRETCLSSSSTTEDPWRLSNLPLTLERTCLSLEFSTNHGNIKRCWSKLKVSRRSCRLSLINLIHILWESRISLSLRTKSCWNLNSRLRFTTKESLTWKKK